MQPIITIPGTIAFLPSSSFSHAIVFVAVQFFSFVTAQEGLYVRLVLRALYLDIFQPDIQGSGGFVETVSRELCSPIHPESQFIPIWHPPAKTDEYGSLQCFSRFQGAATVRENIAEDVSVISIYHHAQTGISAAGPHIRSKR